MGEGVFQDVGFELSKDSCHAQCALLPAYGSRCEPSAVFATMPLLAIMDLNLL